MEAFYLGVHQPRLARRFDRCMLSVNALRGRRSDFAVGAWLLDSGAFTKVARDGGYSEPVEVYAEQINRWARCGELVAAVSEDFMCEPFVLDITGMTVAQHQFLTIERYDALSSLVTGTYLMPVIQGCHPNDYTAHVASYGPRLGRGAWVGVGSICKRNADPAAIVAVLEAIKGVRADLRLHGFGIKVTALNHPRVRHLLSSADSMAWSFAARKAGRDANDWREAERFRQRVEAVAARPGQPGLFDGTGV